MPSWPMHIKTAKEINKKLNLDEKTYVIGNLLCDAERYVINNFSFDVSYDITHYATITHINGFDIKLPDESLYIKKHRSDMDNELIIGYLTHLLTDKFWNNITFSKKYISDTKGNIIGIRLNNGEDYIGSKDNIRKLKQNDFDIYSSHIYKDCIHTINNEDIEKIYPKFKDITEIDYTKEDLIKIIDYINQIDKKYNGKYDKNIKYKVFTEEEFEKYFKESIEYILRILKEVI